MALRPSFVEELLGKGMRVRLPAMGGSMLPLIAPGSVLTIAPLNEARPKEGTVVLYRDGRRMFAHRLLARTRASMPPGSNYAFRGDNLATYDRPSPEHRILGIVELVEPPTISYRRGPGVRRALRQAARFFANRDASRQSGRSGLHK